MADILDNTSTETHPKPIKIRIKRRVPGPPQNIGTPVFSVFVVLRFFVTIFVRKILRPGLFLLAAWSFVAVLGRWLGWLKRVELTASTEENEAGFFFIPVFLHPMVSMIHCGWLPDMRAQMHCGGRDRMACL